jgi:hypothetical protein
VYRACSEIDAVHLPAPREDLAAIGEKEVLICSALGVAFHAPLPTGGSMANAAMPGPRGPARIPDRLQPLLPILSSRHFSIPAHSAARRSNPVPQLAEVYQPEESHIITVSITAPIPLLAICEILMPCL